MADLSVEFAGIKFKNPIVSAAGTPTYNVERLKKGIEAGCGAITTKSISYDPASWPLPYPSNWFYDFHGDPGTLCTIETGFIKPDDGIKQIEELKPFAEKHDCRIIANVDMGNAEYFKDYRDYGKRMEDAGADMIEAACPCPIVLPSIEIRTEWQKINFPKLVENIKAKINIPLIVKVYVGPTLLMQTAKTLEDAGAEAVHNTTYIPGTSIDVETGKPINPTTGLYLGKGLRGQACFEVSQMALPIQSSGGVTTWRDAVERIMCGATQVGICTAVMYGGFKVFTRVIEGMESFMERKGYKKVADFKGVAAPHVENPEEFMEFCMSLVRPKESVKPVVDEEKCNGCEICLACLDGAITVEDDIARIDRDLCGLCGICATICPSKAISYVDV
ncbi:MAG: 4Fe-4S binding protein [Deltaproteobacteria bacterium]|nr:4Fe-4S binding protein [Deltaproteobacteria bacterium]